MTLVLLAQRTRNPGGVRTVEAVAARVGYRLPGVDVRVAYTGSGDDPTLSQALADEPAAPVVVPLLCGRERARTDSVALTAGAVVAAPLGGQRLLCAVLAQRLREAGARAGQPVVLVAAGCVEPSGQGETARAAQLLEESWGGPVRPAHLTGRGLRFSQVVADFRARSVPTPAVVPLLVSQGHLHDRVRVDARTQGVEVCADVLGDSPELAEAVARSYRTTVARRFALSLA